MIDHNFIGYHYDESIRLINNNYCRLRAEVMSVIGDNKEFCADDLDRLHYMEQVWNDMPVKGYLLLIN